MIDGEPLDLSLGDPDGWERATALGGFDRAVLVGLCVVGWLLAAGAAGCLVYFVS